MALIQISEPGGRVATPRRLCNAAGIDLGTTNSLVATVQGGVAETLPDRQGRHLLASAVRYLPNRVIVGEEALEAAVEDPANTIVSVKRLMGRQPAKVAGFSGCLPYRFVQAEGAVARIATAAGPKTAVEVSSEILKVLKQRAENSFGAPLDGVVVTVPAYFDDAQRQATKDAARLAGLDVLRMLNEPTAAAVAYGLDRGDEGMIVVFDLGGGTFDVSVLRLERGVFQVLATGGDTALGGDDFDRLIAGYLIEDSAFTIEGDHSALRGLLWYARMMKEKLSEVEEISCRIGLPGRQPWEQRLHRGDLDRLLGPLLEKVVSVCHEVLHDAHLQPREVKQVVMVGGSTRMPLVVDRVAEVFGFRPLTNIDPDRVVAVGAAIQANVLVGNTPQREMLLLDVVPLSLGIETMGGLVEKIIPRNTAIPVARFQEFTTFKDGQTGMSIHVVQGERELVSECRSLARFELKGLPALVAGAARIRVRFQVDADGLLVVEAEEMTQGVKARIEVHPAYGLSGSEIEAMLEDSMESAAEDMRLRRLKEREVEAHRTIEALDTALAADGEELLEPDEMETIIKARDRLLKALDGGDADAIADAIEFLEHHSETYVARRMNRSIQRVARGRTVEEFSSKP